MCEWRKEIMGKRVPWYSSWRLQALRHAVPIESENTKGKEARHMNRISSIRWDVFRLVSLGYLFLANVFAAQVNVLTVNYDNSRTNSNLSETTLQPSNVNSERFGKIGAFPVDGQIYAQVLYASGVHIPGK